MREREKKRDPKDVFVSPVEGARGPLGPELLAADTQEASCDTVENVPALCFRHLRGGAE